MLKENKAKDKMNINQENTLLKQENTLLKQIVKDLHWMARRYADGRQSYATSLFNDHVRSLLNMNIELNPTGDETIWAKDAMGRSYDKLTEEEASLGTKLNLYGNNQINEEIAYLRSLLLEKDQIIKNLKNGKVELHDFGFTEDGSGSARPKCKKDCQLEVVRLGKCQCTCDEKCKICTAPMTCDESLENDEDMLSGLVCSNLNCSTRKNKK